jgi:hypothetical protein
MRGFGEVMQPSNLWALIGGVILVAVVVYFGFQAVDATGLAAQLGTATVISKEHKKAGKTYRTDIVAGQTRVIPQDTPEMYLVKLRIGDKETTHAVERDLFDSLNNGDQLAVSYQQRRFTGGVQVIRVERRSN